MQIGSMEIPEGAGLAPMAGVTDACFRPLCFEMGAAYAVSEMVSAKGLLHMSRNQRAVDELLMRAEGEGVLGLQLFGHEPALFAEAASSLQNAGFQFIDINMGCPTHKIVSNGDGSALMRDPALCGRIVRAAVDATTLPVTVKLRAGWDEESINAPEIARICEDNGACAITVHGRTRGQFYSGQADWDVIRRVKQAVAVPVIGNGDVRCGADALRMMRETGCDGVCVGRAAQGNPWIFREIRAAMLGEPYCAPDMRERVNMALRHIDAMLPIRGERGTVLEMRKHIAWYLSGERGCARLRGKINEMQTLGHVRTALNEYLRTLEDEGEAGAP